MTLADFAARATGRVLKVVGFGIALAGLGCGAQFAVADDVPPFAPGMITHMQQMTQFTDADRGSQLTPPVIPRFGVNLDPSGAVATFPA